MVDKDSALLGLRSGERFLPMSNALSSFLKKRLLRKDQNLVSTDDPYQVMKRLLSRHSVTGILDAGASNGRISLRLLRLFPQATAYAFEPNPFYQETLTHKAKADPRLRPQFLALSDREGSVPLHIAESPGISSFFTPSQSLKRLYPEDSTIREAVQVEAVTVDNWASQAGVKSIELMKFDIQGAELLALHGAKKMIETATLAIYIELLFNTLYEGNALHSQIDLFLREAGFMLFDFYKPRYDRQGKLLWANALFLHSGRLRM
jgi:FkbM family methyltransferase